MEFVAGRMAIGKSGLIVDGKPASLINHFNDLEELPGILGQGSFGIVKKVRDKNTGIIYAMKVCFC